MKLDKTHYNDAIVISGINEIKENPEEWLLIKQFRKKKRSLHEATARKGRKKPNRNQTRNSKNTPYYKGFYLNDKVSVCLLYTSSFYFRFCRIGKNLWK